jgi:hypothetical protein
MRTGGRPLAVVAGDAGGSAQAAAAANAEATMMMRFMVAQRTTSSLRGQRFQSLEKAPGGFPTIGNPLFPIGFRAPRAET